jgi:hypothetical protein
MPQIQRVYSLNLWQDFLVSYLLNSVTLFLRLKQLFRYSKAFKSPLVLFQIHFILKSSHRFRIFKKFKVSSGIWSHFYLFLPLIFPIA